MAAIHAYGCSKKLIHLYVQYSIDEGGGGGLHAYGRSKKLIHFYVQHPIDEGGGGGRRQ